MANETIFAVLKVEALTSNRHKHGYLVRCITDGDVKNAKKTKSAKQMDDLSVHWNETCSL